MSYVKTALVTGAAGDIGADAAKRLNQLGYQLTLIDINKEKLDEVSKSIPGSTAIVADLRQGNEFDALLKQIKNELPPLDIAFVNAGAIAVGDLLDLNENQIDLQLDINLRSAIHLIKACAENMKTKGRGHIISTVSMGGIVSLKGSATYSASKAGLRAFLAGIRDELGPFGIKVTGIYPSGVDTQMLRHETLNGGSNLNFVSPPLSVEEVGKAVIKTLNSEKLEVYLPYSESISARLVAAFPWTVRYLYPLMNWIGKRGRTKYLNKIQNTTETTMTNQNNHQIDEILSSKDGHLHIEERDTNDLLEEFGSPLFVVSEQQLRNNYQRFHKAFAKHWPNGEVDVLPANKANWNTAVRTVLSEEGAGADIYSEGELHSALRCNTKPDLISVNGGGKSDDVLRQCIEADVRITVEDLDEPERINSIAKSLNKIAKIRFRVKPDFPNLWKRTDFSLESASIDLGIQVYKSGIPAQYLEDLGKQVLKMENVEMTGIHFHGGRHSNSLWYWKGMMKRYAQLVLHLCEAWGGYQPKELDIGGGFATERDPHSKLGERENAVMTFFTYPFELAMYGLGSSGRYKTLSTMIEKVMSKMPGKERAPSVEEYAEAAVGSFRDTLIAGGMKLNDVKLQIEPGRSFYSNTGIHLTKVKKFKQQTQPMKMNWVLTDTTYFFLSGGIYEYNFHEFKVANKMNAPAKHVADIVGHSCYADRISPLVKVPDLEENDVIAFLDMGAYQEVSASNFNALPRPAMVMVNGDQAEVIKRAESIDDVFARDIIPERLQQTESNQGKTTTNTAKSSNAKSKKGALENA